MPLKFPLHHYDEAGRLKPPLTLYVLLLFLCRGFLLLVISLSFREDSSRMMSLFFPNKFDFYWSLLPTVPAFCLLAILSQRTKLWQKEVFVLFKLIPWLLAVALLLDMAVQISILWRMHFQFSLAHGASVLIAFFGLMYIKQSRHMRDLPIDWSKAN